MSQTSRKNDDTGERHRDDNLDQDVQHAPIKFRSARATDWTIAMPKELADRAELGRKHREDLGYELAMLWRRYVNDGEFGVSMELLDELYSTRLRKKLKAILDDMATCVRRHSNFGGTGRCKGYRFNFPRPRKWPTYNGIPDDPGDPPNQPTTKLVRVTVPATWLWKRYERWSAICERHGWVSQLDLDGRTDWGRPLLAALDATSLPVAPETVRLTERGVVRAARRKHGRCYHPLTNLAKKLRRASLIDGEPIVEIDIHACYTALLISRLPEGEGKGCAISAIQDDWYKQFQPAYEEWLLDQHAKGRAYQDATGAWMLRVDDDPSHDVPASIKVEYMRQCLFGRDGRDASNPLRVTLRQLHPDLCTLIEDWRKRMNPTELSHVLTKAEGSMIVDSAMTELEGSGIRAIPLHDAVGVQESEADRAQELLLGVAEWHLDFQPLISVKAAKADVSAEWKD